MWKIPHFFLKGSLPCFQGLGRTGWRRPLRILLPRWWRLLRPLRSGTETPWRQWDWIRISLNRANFENVRCFTNYPNLPMAPSIASHLSMPRAIFPIESIAGARRKQNAGEGEVWRGLYRAGGRGTLGPGSGCRDGRRMQEAHHQGGPSQPHLSPHWSEYDDGKAFEMENFDNVLLMKESPVHYSSITYRLKYALTNEIVK